MLTLHHFPLDPYSRKVRIVLGEKRLEFGEVEERPWEGQEALLALNPAGQVPVLVDGPLVVADATAICEYLDEMRVEPPLIGTDPAERAEVRRLVGWFDRLFDHDVTQMLVGEKIMKRVARSGQPDSRFVRAGYNNIHPHLQYLGWLVERRKWLAGDRFSLADITAAAHLSCIDYIGDVPWEQHAAAKDWYARVKSRPSFRPLLTDHLAGITPPPHYADLDF